MDRRVEAPLGLKFQEDFAQSDVVAAVDGAEDEAVGGVGAPSTVVADGEALDVADVCDADEGFGGGVGEVVHDDYGILDGGGVGGVE
mmetsp:Transcript_7866/g.16064  ORF Transcript_7866/g.16064 Transcript_7866/m.16064 type:complete len:87 (+) Transcript_7866:3-263(+)